MAEDAPKKENVPATYEEDVNKKSSTGMDPKVANLIAYLFSWIGGLIIWLIEKENRWVKWNALQALILGIFEVASIVIFSSICAMNYTFSKEDIY